MALAPTRRGVERQLRKAIWTGRPVDLRSGNARVDDPAHGASWDAQRTVAAGLLTELLVSTEGSRRPRALRLAGARIVGRLDLEAIELACPLLLRGCWFAEAVDLEEAQAPFGWWLQNDAVPYSAEELHASFRRPATQGVRRFLAAT